MSSYFHGQSLTVNKKTHLVGGIPTPLKNMSVGVTIPNIGENKKCSKPPTGHSLLLCWLIPIYRKTHPVGDVMSYSQWLKNPSNGGEVPLTRTLLVNHFDSIYIYILYIYTLYKYIYYMYISFSKWRIPKSSRVSILQLSNEMMWGYHHPWLRKAPSHHHYSSIFPPTPINTINTTWYYRYYRYPLVN